MRCSISTCRSDRQNLKTDAHWLRDSPDAQWALPLRGEGKIRWNTRGVPYVIAGNLHDAAVLAGAASYLLRANQIQLFRHVAWGRLAELAGPLFIRTDAMIRSLNLHKAQDEIIGQLPAQTREWIEAFCAGINAVAATMPRNREARLLGIHHRPFDVRDILAIGRLTGTDVNWPMLFDLFPLSEEEGFSGIWRRILAAGGLGTAASSSESETTDFWLLRANRSGSNCMAIHGSLTASGKPILASDPHLNHQLPNLWLLIGIQCPQLHAVGLMFPGLPVIGLGRNPHLAWGGTNLRASSSDLVKLDADDIARLQSCETKIRVRGWPTVRRVLRNSAHGPVISDHLGWKHKRKHEVLALRWTGHLPSDEVTAFLRLMQCKQAVDIQDCMQTYAVTGLNILAADSQGNIAQTHAVWLPNRSGFSDAHFIVESSRARTEWSTIHTSNAMPLKVNPAAGYLVSTNQHPRADIPVSWFFNGEERNQRLRHLLEMNAPVRVHDVRRWQTDVYSQQAMALSRSLIEHLAPLCVSTVQANALSALRQWDGRYEARSTGALVFEAVLSGLRDTLLRHQGGVSGWWVVQEWAFISNFLLEDVLSLPVGERNAVLSGGLKRAARIFKRHRTWGAVHRLAPRHVLGFLPWVGKRWFPNFDSPASGSRETLMKNAHGWLQGRSRSTYGAQARQICDLSDVDANWFVLLGGQDERVESPHALDQAGLWSLGQYVRLPLSAPAIATNFGRIWHFEPDAYSSK